ncbi:MAG: serine/threonine-protein kinase [Coleofasciculus sp. G1-WW12-02]|uniref:protein kinase domain-containing protein n=1 Tax=Coleofasciculus sp. G1-WW12-02 TaxID=3068483 RepID=UPI0032F0B94F
MLRAIRRVDQRYLIIKQRYLIRDILGSGGFSNTYLAQDLCFPASPPLVVKQLQPSVENRQSFHPDKILEWFHREATALARLGNHPQIPRLFDYFMENGEFYLIQEFIEGHDLSQELSGRQLTETKVLTLLQEILEVLEVVHRHGIIHRDIKPENIMRRHTDGKIVLIDFGLIKEIFPRSNYSPANLTMGVGTPGYVPYEQANGSPQLSSDIYAVGMIGIQALTGYHPEELKNIYTHEIIWRDKVFVSPELAEVLDRMVRHRFWKRYPSATEALQDIKWIISRRIERNKLLMRYLKPKAFALASVQINRFV